MNFRKLSFLLLSTILLLTSCSDDNKESFSIEGTWKLDKYSATAKTNKPEYDDLLKKFVILEFSAEGKESVDTSETFTFHKDKTYVFNTTGVSGTYKIEDNKIILTPNKIDDDNTIQVFEFLLEENSLFFISDKTAELLEYYTNKQIGETVGANLDDMEITKATLNIQFKRVN